MTNNTNFKIPMWVNIVQVLLILIMAQQVYMFYFDHAVVAISGITVEGTANKNLLYEFAGRTATMAVVSLIVLLTQNPRYLLVVLLMNIFREGQETIIDPLYPLANAPISPTADLIAHLVIIAIEVLAFIAVYKVVRSMDKAAVE